MRKLALASLLGSLSVLGSLSASETAWAGDSDVSFKTRTEVTGYKDTDATNVITPGIRADVLSVTSGWDVGASFLVDVVTAASTDVVSTASPKWTDVRYVPGLDAKFKAGPTTISLGAGGSIESDYWAGSGSVGISFDLAQKTITPAFSYGFGYDIAGRRDTPLSVYSLEMMSHAFNLSINFVVNKSTIFVPGFAAVIEVGDQEKPYRWLPTFTEGTEVANGASREEVDKVRTSARLGENTPDLRTRYALSGLIAHRFGKATIRVEERLYIDNWLLMATTTDGMLPIDVSSAVRIWPHLRFHAQKGVDFWNRAYVVSEDNQGNVIAPQLRTGDRELGPLLGATGGAGIRFGSETVGFTISADAIYTHFLDQLYITDRLAGFGALVFDGQVN